MDFADACRKAKFRNQRRFVQDRIWRWLKRHHPARVQEGVAALGLNRRAVSNGLLALKARGLAYCVGLGAGARWMAVGKSPPEDMRGTSVNSERNLERAGNWHETLPMANVARGCPQANDLLLATIKQECVIQKRRDSTPREIVVVPTLADLCGALIKEAR